MALEQTSVPDSALQKMLGLQADANIHPLLPAIVATMLDGKFWRLSLR